MFIVVCPECGKQLSQYAEMCPECGFPIKKFITEHNFTDLDKVMICPKCADVHRSIGAAWLKCRYCNTELIQTDLGKEKWNKFVYDASGEEVDNKQIELAKQYGNDQFDEQMFKTRSNERDERIAMRLIKEPVKTTPLNTPKCPTCGSTNIQKIGTAERVTSVLGLGLFSKKINKTYKCKNCGYTW